MNKERYKPPQPRPRWIDRMQLALSTSQHVDGIWIGSYSTPKDMPRIEQALLLVKQHSPVRYARIVRELDRVWIFLLAQSIAEYHNWLKACVLDERYVADPATSIEQIATTIVHEATHARLERLGFRYEEKLRVRIEGVCVRRELAFAARLPGGVRIQEDRAQHLDWYRANPDSFLDTNFAERQTKGEIEMLRHIGAPDWFIRTMPIVQSMISRVRRFFHIAWPQGQ